jgi:hypothetical protein
MKMHKNITVEQIMSRGPCGRYPESHVQELIGGGKTPLEILKLPISIEDRFWVVLHVAVLSPRILRLFACMCAERALLRERAHGREPQLDSWRVLEIARKCANGKATEEEMSNAYVAAVDAANDVAVRSAYLDACIAADAAVYVAAHAAANAASNAAHAAADYDAEREQQVNDLIKLIVEYKNA